MYNFILQTIIMVSLGTVIYLFARAVPRVDNSVTSKQGRDYIEELLNKLPLEKADAFLSALFEKILMKLKVVILKLDNLLTRHLHNLTPIAGIGKNEAASQLFSASAGDKPEVVEKPEKSDNLK